MSEDDETPRPRKKRRRASAGAVPTTPHDPRPAARAEIASTGPSTATAPTFESVRRPLLVSAVAAAVGLAIVGTSANAVGPWILAAGVIGLVASIHRLGRLGPA